MTVDSGAWGVVHLVIRSDVESKMRRRDAAFLVCVRWWDCVFLFPGCWFEWVEEGSWTHGEGNERGYESLFLTDVTGTDTANVNHDGLVCECVWVKGEEKEWRRSGLKWKRRKKRREMKGVRLCIYFQKCDWFSSHFFFALWLNLLFFLCLFISLNSLTPLLS